MTTNQPAAVSEHEIYNPAKVPADKVGAGWRLLNRVEAQLPTVADDEFWSHNADGWARAASGFIPLDSGLTIRRLSPDDRSAAQSPSSPSAPPPVTEPYTVATSAVLAVIQAVKDIGTEVGRRRVVEAALTLLGEEKP